MNLVTGKEQDSLEEPQTGLQAMHIASYSSGIYYLAYWDSRVELLACYQNKSDYDDKTNNDNNDNNDGE